MNPSRVVIGLLALSAVSPALANGPRWFALLQASSEHQAEFVDGASLTRDGPQVTFWQHQVLDGAMLARGDVRQIKAHVRMDCDKRKFVLDDTTLFDQQGRVVSTDHAGTKVWDIKPRSGSEAIRSVVCDPQFGVGNILGVFPVSADLEREAPAVFNAIKGAASAK